MNERGMVILDSILVLAILLLISLSMVPAVSFLKVEVHYARQLVHASEVAYIGASKVKYEFAASGTHEIDGVLYRWFYNSQEICVDFESIKGEESYCIQANQAVN